MPDTEAVHDGLADAVEAHGAASLAYAEVVAGSQARATVEEAFAAVRDALDGRDGPPPSAEELTTLTHDALREAAARRLPRSTPALPGSACEHVPVVLAARANGDLTEGDRDLLIRHLSRCTECAELERRVVSAEPLLTAGTTEPPPDWLREEFGRSGAQEWLATTEPVPSPPQREEPSTPGGWLPQGLESSAPPETAAVSTPAPATESWAPAANAAAVAVTPDRSWGRSRRRRRVLLAVLGLAFVAAVGTAAATGALSGLKKDEPSVPAQSGSGAPAPPVSAGDAMTQADERERAEAAARDAGDAHSEALRDTRAAAAKKIRDSRNARIRRALAQARKKPAAAAPVVRPQAPAAPRAVRPTTPQPQPQAKPRPRATPRPERTPAGDPPGRLPEG